MSNQKSSRQSPTKPPKTPSTPSKPKEPVPTKENPLPPVDPNAAMAFLMKILGPLEQVVQPLADFHAAKKASDNDLRLYFDIRAMKGKTEYVSHIHHEVVLPELMSPKMIGSAGSIVSQEVMGKIAVPLAAVLQEHAEALLVGTTGPDAAEAEGYDDGYEMAPVEDVADDFGAPPALPPPDDEELDAAPAEPEPAEGGGLLEEED